MSKKGIFEGWVGNAQYEGLITRSDDDPYRSLEDVIAEVAGIEPIAFQKDGEYGRFHIIVEQLEEKE